MPRFDAKLIEQDVGPALVKLTLQSFVNTSHPTILQLHKSFINNDGKQFKICAHSIKSFALTLHANTLRDLALEVEELALRIMEDRQEVLNRMSALQCEFASVLAEVQEMLKTLERT